MRKIIPIILLLILIPALCMSGTLQNAHRSVIAKKNASAPAGDSCTGDLLFSWHAENVDLASETGCSVGDTTATALSDVSLSTTQKHDGTYSIKPTSTSDYYEFAVSTEDIVKSDAGRITGWVYNPAGAGTNYIAFVRGDGNNTILIWYTTNTIRVSYKGNSTGQELAGPTNSITDDAWTYFEASWSVTAVSSHYLRLGTSSDGATPTNWTYHDTAITDMAVTPTSVRFGETQGEAFDHYIDTIKIYGVW
jgi:hypothetical protein